MKPPQQAMEFLVRTFCKTGCNRILERFFGLMIDEGLNVLYFSVLSALPFKEREGRLKQ